ncbi:DUF6090 family protein [Winogradskyella pulchriflava]|uniref:DUF6090 family protein n=1 Tax=Winogradskyella pulchriflava TaxID=1110688 RepID=A0ABV6Q5S0_9FLAO
MENNKTNRYLKYAIGEIILVVIGILIALQINNWNEDRKATIIEENFFDSVLIDIEKDEEKLIYYEHFHTKRIEYLDTLLTYVRNPKRPMGLNKFAQYIEPLFYSVSPTVYNTTFESAKSSGVFSNIKAKDLMKQLSQYYADFTQIENTFNSITRFVENQLEPLLYNFPEDYMTSETGRLVINEEDVNFFYKKIASIEDQRNLNTDYNAILRTPKLENIIIGDMGRTFNIIGKIETRIVDLRQLRTKIINRD